MLDNREVWRDCKGYEGKYQVSNMGRVWSVHSQKYISPFTNPTGYLRVSLRVENGKMKKEYVHRLVALAFVENPNKLTEVHHIDSNPANNKATNLQWVTHKENLRDNHRVELMSKGVMCVETGKSYASIQEVAKTFGVHPSHIGEVCKGIRQTCGGYHWKFTE